jgi:hypothetical protein
MDDYTALHRHLGLPRGPVTDELLDAAVGARLEETDDLDWKIVPTDRDKLKEFKYESFPEDVSAFANAGGGTLVWGVAEKDSAAQNRTDAGIWTDGDLRTLRTIAANRLQPSVLNLRIHRLQREDERAVIIVVPPSLDRPHFIHKDERYAARLRVGSGSRWMTEREIAEAYRRRFSEQRDAAAALDRLFEGAQVDIAASQRAWAFAAARPRLPIAGPAELGKDGVQKMINSAKASTESMLRRPAAQPLHGVDHLNLRPGLRRWTARARLARDPSLHAWTSVHQNGSVTLSAALHGNPSPAASHLPQLERAQVPTALIEAFVANLISLIGQVGLQVGAMEYEVRIGLAWPQNDPLTFLPLGEDSDLLDLANVPRIRYFEPVEALIALDSGPDGVLQQVRDLATDCVNQGAVEDLVLLRSSM